MSFRFTLVIATFAMFPISGWGEQPELVLPEEPFHYAEQKWPEYFVAAKVEMYDTTPADNPVTDAGATLGRVLFYDKRLSVNGSISCASCHQQRSAFADPRKFSVGFQGEATERNSMPLTDLRFVRAGFFWDERATTLEAAVLLPVYSHVEMGHTSKSLVASVQAEPRYAKLFQAAFGAEEISEARIARALAQFLRAITSTQSKYDAGAGQAESSTQDFPNFTSSENLGKSLFFEKCQACHHLGNARHVAIFAMFRSLNNGIDADATVRDGGRGDATFNPNDVGLFKGSSLRNIEYTAPYMHDGRLATLEDVIHHYSEQVNRHPTVGPARRFQFSTAEQKGLVDFLKTLSDHQLISDPRFSNPWSENSSEPEGKIIATAASTAANSESSIDARERLRNGQGISPAETIHWLASLDADGDGQLKQPELQPVVDILIKSNRVAAGRGGRGARVPRAERVRRSAGPRRTDDDEVLPDPEGQPPQVADLNGDGKVDDAEFRNYQSLARVLTIYDGGRLEVFIDRVFNGYNLTASEAREVRSSIRSAKQELNSQWKQLDIKTIELLAKTQGEVKFREYQAAIVDGQVVSTVSGEATDAAVKAAWDKIWESDQNGDSQLNEQERFDLAKILSTDPGGFGQTEPSGIDVRQFVQRLMAFDDNHDQALETKEVPERWYSFVVAGDADQDGKLTADEAANYFQMVAFERIVEGGIYIGGAFANALQQTSYRLDSLSLSPQVREACQEILKDHDRQMKALSNGVVEEQAARIQRLHLSKVRASAEN